MRKVTVWVCSEDESHIFKDPPNEYYCHIGQDYHGYLEKKVIEVEEDEVEEDKIKKTQNPVGERPPHPGSEIGLCVILMDASTSMTETPFDSTPLTRMNLIATSAAQGIFELERMQNNKNAYIALFKFDDKVEKILVDSVANLLNRFNNSVKEFANFIYDELFQMQGGTDINQALKQSYSFIEKYLKKQLHDDFPINNYNPIQQIILTKTEKSVAIANIRVLIYTDGMQFDANQNRLLKDNPFRLNTLPGLNHDIVIGAFFGKETDEGCKELKGLMSNCPIHDVPQFFLIDNPKQLGVLKNLFRMASGASGFCPICLEKKLYR